MATLQTLPNELLRLVLDLVGLQYFRTDVRRLCMYRQWYLIAQEMLIRTFLLYPRNLVQYENCQQHTLYARVKDEARDVRISLFHDTNSEHHAQSVFEGWDKEFNFPGKKYLPYTQPNLRLNHTMHSDLRSYIAEFVDALHGFKKMEAFRLRISDKGHPAMSVDRGSLYPYQPLVKALEHLAANIPAHLTTLEISLDNEAFAFVGGSQPHHCPLIARFLPTVKNLAVHLESTCPDVLRLAEEDTMTGLERLIVNCDPRTDSRRHELGYWNGCRPSRSAIGRFFSLQQADLVDAGRALASRMKDPKLVRLLFGIGPNCQEVVSVDCITGDEMRLPPGARPFDDGDVVEDGAVQLSHYAPFWNRKL